MPAHRQKDEVDPRPTTAKSCNSRDTYTDALAHQRIFPSRLPLKYPITIFETIMSSGDLCAFLQPMRVINPCGPPHLRHGHDRRRRPEASTKACSRLVRLPFVWRSATPQFRQRLAHSARKWKPIYEKSGKSIKNPVQNQDRLAAQNESCESRIQRRILTWGRQAAPESVPPGGPELGPRF